MGESPEQIQKQIAAPDRPVRASKAGDAKASARTTLSPTGSRG